MAETTADLNFEPPGTLCNEEETKQVLAHIRTLCKWKIPTFPGSQPVSLSNANLGELAKNPYVACEKSDGIRYLLFASSGHSFLIDRKQIVRKLDLHLPQPSQPNTHQSNTLLDGELVIDKEPQLSRTIERDERIVSTSVPRYLIYDAVYVNNRSVREHNLLYRLKKVAVDVIKPYVAYYFPADPCISSPSKTATSTSDRSAERLPPLEIYLKDFFDIGDISNIFSFSGKLPHLSDGIIFTPIRKPYAPGTCKALLKWKPPHLNTADFAADMLCDDNQRPRFIKLYVAERGIRTWRGLFAAPYGEVYKSLMEQSIMSHAKISQLIVECYWVPSSPVCTFQPTLRMQSQAGGHNTSIYDCDVGTWVKGGWVIERIRYDKTMPNDKTVVDRVFDSINDGITFDHLCSTFKKYREQGKHHCAQLCSLPPYYQARHGS